jgi:hypothetical protein
MIHVRIPCRNGMCACTDALTNVVRAQVRATLIKAGYAISPVVFLDAGIPPEQVGELTNMVESMKGKVVADRNAVGLTHIVFPFGEEGDPDDGEEYMRLQARRHPLLALAQLHRL